MTSRSAEFMANLTFGNKSVIQLCIICYAYQVIFDPPLIHYTMCPRNILYLQEWYRILTSSFFHGGLMHIAMNLMATVSLGSLLERRFGTFRFVFTILWSVLLTGIIYIGVAWIVSTLFHNDQLMYQNSVGFSGIVFHLVVLEANLRQNRNSSRDIFGFLRVPVKAYPWVLLVVLQFFMPNISFMGHLSGILVGTLQYHGNLDCLLPSYEFQREMETWESLAIIIRRKGFIPTPTDSEISSFICEETRQNSILTSILDLIKLVIKFLKDILVTIKVSIFGHGPILDPNLFSRSDQQEEEWEVQQVSQSEPTHTWV